MPKWHSVKPMLVLTTKGNILAYCWTIILHSHEPDKSLYLSSWPLCDKMPLNKMSFNKMPLNKMPLNKIPFFKMLFNDNLQNVVQQNVNRWVVTQPTEDLPNYLIVEEGQPFSAATNVGKTQTKIPSSKVFLPTSYFKWVLQLALEQCDQKKVAECL